MSPNLVATGFKSLKNSFYIFSQIFMYFLNIL